jgi:hypothetical protein
MEIVTLKKGDEVKDFRTDNGKILATIEVAGRSVSNPTLDMLYADGWEVYKRPSQPPHEPTRDELINSAIRERYTSDDEAQIVREMIAGKTGARERFTEYNAYVESILDKYADR